VRAALTKMEKGSSPATTIQVGLENAARLGHRAFAVRMSETTLTSPSAQGFSLEWGREARVELTTHLPWDPDTTLTRTVPIEDVWSVATAGNTVARIAAPAGGGFYLAASSVPYQGVGHLVYVIDRTGLLLLDSDVVPYDDEDERPAEKRLRYQAMRFMPRPARERLGRASKVVNRNARVNGYDPCADDILDTAMTAHVREKPEQRGLDPFRAALTWCYSLAIDGRDYVVASSDRLAPVEPHGRLATAGIDAVAKEAWGRTRPELQGSTERERLLRIHTGPKGSGVLPSIDAIVHQPPGRAKRPVGHMTDIHGRMASDWQLRQRGRDPTGETAARLADGTLPVTEALALGLDPETVITTWRNVGLTKVEIETLALAQCGYTQREIAELAKRSPSVINKRLKVARQKISDF
jgi:hypothetical protein